MIDHISMRIHFSISFHHFDDTLAKKEIKGKTDQNYLHLIIDKFTNRTL